MSPRAIFEMVAAVSSLTDRMERLVRQTKRMRLEMKDDAALHLQPCGICKLTLTRFGTCLECAERTAGNGNLE